MPKTIKTVTEYEFDDSGRKIKETTTVTETDNHPLPPYTRWTPRDHFQPSPWWGGHLVTHNTGLASVHDITSKIADAAKSPVKGVSEGGYL